MLVQATFVVLATIFFAIGAVPTNVTSETYVRPCHFGNYRCIADNLAVNSQCNQRVRGGIPPAYTIRNFHYETPYFNASYIDDNLIVRNHNRCFVSEFFFNTKSNNVVLSMDCPGLIFESNRTLLQHYSKKEDSIYHYNINGYYPLVRLTTHLHYVKKFDLCSAFTFGDVAVLPTFKVDPSDRPTKKFLSQDLSFIPIYERETFLYRAPQLARYFINSMICDFGCNF